MTAPTPLTLSADGPVLIALDAARRMLAATAQWTTIASAAKIHYDALPAAAGANYTRAELVAARPFALIWSDLSSGYKIESGSHTPHCPNQSGVIIVQIELNVPPEHANNPQNLSLWANRLLGRIIRTGSAQSPGLWDLSRTADYLPIDAIELHSYERTTKKEATELGDAIIAELALHWSNK